MSWLLTMVSCVVTMTGLLGHGSCSRLSLSHLNSADHFFTMPYEGAFSPYSIFIKGLIQWHFGRQSFVVTIESGPKWEKKPCWYDVPCRVNTIRPSLSALVRAVRKPSMCMRGELNEEVASPGSLTATAAGEQIIKV